MLVAKLFLLNKIIIGRTMRNDASLKTLKDFDWSFEPKPKSNTSRLIAK